MISLDAPVFIDDECVGREIEDSSHCPERLLEGRELQELIQDAIMQLSTDLRMVILLRDVQGLSYQEIAQVENCSVEAIKSRLFRARGYLRKVLGPHLHPQQAPDETGECEERL